MRRRPGMSLVELLTIMSGLSVILTMSATLITRMMHTQAETRSFFDRERRAMDLSQLFRGDVHQARSAETDQSALKEGELVRLQLDGGQTAIYRREAESIRRVVSAEGRPTSRDEFPLGRDLKIGVERLHWPARLALSVATDLNPPPPGPNDPPSSVRDAPVSVLSEAVLGRDLRFAKSPSKEETAP